MAPQATPNRPRNKQLKVSIATIVVELPKSGQLKEWRWMNVIIRVGIAIGKNKFVMNAVIDQNEQFWLDLE